MRVVFCTMRMTWLLVTLGLFSGIIIPAADESDQTGFTLEQVLSYPYPSDLVAAPSGSRLAWVLNEKGIRNIWVAEGPDFKPRMITSYRSDDGQDLSGLVFTPDGRRVIYVRGGDHHANWPAEGNLAPSPLSSPVQPKVQLWTIPFDGGSPELLSDGDQPAVSPRGDSVAFTREHAIWTVPVAGGEPAKRLFFARGESRSPVWSPDGMHLAFVSHRGDHSFIGVFTNESVPIRWLAPSTSRDTFPRWSPDGKRIAFVRQPGTGGAPEPRLERRPAPWSIWVADRATGALRLVWKSPETLWGSYPTTHGQVNLHWASQDRLVFLADLDGWPHLYSIAAAGGETLLLTPGKFMVEFISLSPDRRFLVYAANNGAAGEDIDRRHVFKVPVDRATPVAVTKGEGIEWLPCVTGDGRDIAFLGAGSRRPPLPMIMPVNGGSARMLGEDRIPRDFPVTRLVVPRMVIYKAPDGLEVHAQRFDPPGGVAKKPAIIYVHGGPPRQMLLGWHYSNYYTHAYAVNQYLASRGYVVLAVNYRLGIGYGHDFQHPAQSGPRGASEYQDIKAAAEHLRSQPQVDPKRIGIWGGSYGGYLTALALARNSDLFAAGVDLHGVHDFTAEGGRRLGGTEWSYEKGDFDKAADVAWQSSPVSSVNTWKSPVLLIHGDDDRNVRFHQTVDLVQRLTAAGIPFEELVLPDEIHGFLRHESWLMGDRALVAFFDKVFRMARSTTAP